MVGCALIGTPKGFDFAASNISLPIGKYADLKNEMINVFPNSEIWMVKRERIDGKVVTFYAVYRFAVEPDSGRGGAYYGSVIVLENADADAQLIFQSLGDLADIVKENCVSPEGVFYAPISTLRVSTPPSYQELKERERDFTHEYSALTPKLALFVPLSAKGENSKAEWFKALDQTNILQSAALIYASSSPAVLEDVRKKSFLQIVSIKNLSLKQKDVSELMLADLMAVKRAREKLEAESLEKDRRQLEKEKSDAERLRLAQTENDRLSAEIQTLNDRLKQIKKEGSETLKMEPPAKANKTIDPVKEKAPSKTDIPPDLFAPALRLFSDLAKYPVPFALFFSILGIALGAVFVSSFSGSTISTPPPTPKLESTVENKPKPDVPAPPPVYTLPPAAPAPAPSSVEKIIPATAENTCAWTQSKDSGNLILVYKGQMDKIEDLLNKIYENCLSCQTCNDQLAAQIRQNNAADVKGRQMTPQKNILIYVPSGWGGHFSSAERKIFLTDSKDMKAVVLVKK